MRRGGPPVREAAPFGVRRGDSPSEPPPFASSPYGWPTSSMPRPRSASIAAIAT